MGVILPHHYLENLLMLNFKEAPIHIQLDIFTSFLGEDPFYGNEATIAAEDFYVLRALARHNHSAQTVIGKFEEVIGYKPSKTRIHQYMDFIGDSTMFSSPYVYFNKT